MCAKRRGFTLLELLAVLAIVSILVGVGIKGYRLAGRQTKESRAEADIEKLRTALNEYRVEFGCYPVLEGGAFHDLDSDSFGFLSRAVEDVSLTDPWGNPYWYVCTNRFLYRIGSNGEDGIANTSDDITPSVSGY
jgi:general secretion pathway protein G